MPSRRAILLAAFAAPAFAQGLSISGRVRGPQGPLPDATVTLRGATTGRRITQANSQGEYQFSGLDNGSYDLTFESPGYRTATLRVPLSYDPESGEINVTLQPE
jgi:hypothetical protein